MSTFKNVTDVDLEVQVDGNRIAVAAGDTFKVHDDHDYSLENQPAFELVKSPKAAAADTTHELSSVTEGAK